MISASVEFVDCSETKSFVALQEYRPVSAKPRLFRESWLRVMESSMLDETPTDESETSNSLPSFSQVMFAGGTANDEQFNSIDSPISCIERAMGFTLNCGTAEERNSKLQV